MQVLCIGSIKINEENYETQILYNDYSFVYKIKEILDDLVELLFIANFNYQMSLNHFALHIHRLFLEIILRFTFKMTSIITLKIPILSFMS